MKKRLAVLAAVCLLGCAKTVTAYTDTSLEAGFDTVFSYTEYTDSRDTFTAHFESSVNAAKTLSGLFDIYGETVAADGLKAVSEAAGKEPVTVGADVIELLKEAKELYDLTDGAFDITAGAVTRLWHEYREEGIRENNAGRPGNVPSEEEISEALQHRGWQHIHIDEKHMTVFIDDPDISFDAGGIAKGYAAEKLAQLLQEDGAETAVVNAGRNIRTIGTKPGNAPWVISVASPAGDGTEAARIRMTGSCSFVTSGDYERFYTDAAGTRYSHITDMKTGMPARLYHSVTIITENSAFADGLSTALFTVSVEEGKTILQEYEKRTGQSAGAVWILDKDTYTEEGTVSGAYRIIATEDLSSSLEIR